jgi:hypothetical protein
MVRVSIADDSPLASGLIGENSAAAVPPISLAASRRVILIRDSSTSLGMTTRLLTLWIAVVSSKYPQ